MDAATVIGGLRPNHNNNNHDEKFAGIKAWRYMYNDAGDLVGFSDPRGCGANYFTDGLGRTTLEDYFPCEPHHEPYSEPTFENYFPTSGVESYFIYDSSLDPTLQPEANFMKGQLSVAWSLGRADAFN